MKKHILLGFLAVTFISCSDDDNSPPIVNPPAGTDLDTITFINGGERDIMVFEDNKIRQQRIGNNWDGTYDLNHNYTYNQDGQLIGMIGVDKDGQTYFERTITYDAQGRIVAKNDIYYNSLQGTSSTENVVYIYDDEQNTVTADFTSDDDMVQDRTYYFNDAGLVYKVTNGDQIAQNIQYEGNNISAINDYSCVYDLETPVMGEYLNIYRNQYNSYKNFVVAHGYVVVASSANNYLTKYDNAQGIAQDVDYEYEFNEAGYPVKVITTTPAGYSSETVITYK